MTYGFAGGCDALSTGVALAVTVAVFYALCTLVWLLAPVSKNEITAKLNE